MKKSRIAAVALATALTAGAVTPVVDAQTYPEPLNQVMNELRKVGGPQAPNLLLVPAATSSIGWILSILAWTGACRSWYRWHRCIQLVSTETS